MIEHVTGPGSSGIAENSGKAGIAENSAKTGKQATNGPFAKLMSMLGKQGKSAAKTSLIKHSKAQHTTVHTQLIQQKIKQKVMVSHADKAITKKVEKHSQENNDSTAQAVALQIMIQTPHTTLKLTGSKFIMHKQVTDKQGHAHFTAAKQGYAQLTSARQAAAQLTSSRQTDAQLASAKQASTIQAGAQLTSAKQASAEQAGAQLASAKQASTIQAGAQLASAKQASAEQAGAQLASAKQSSAIQADAQLASAKQTSAEQAGAQLASAKQASAEQAGAQLTSNKQMSTQPLIGKDSVLQFPPNHMKGSLSATQSLAAKQHPSTLHVSAGKAGIADTDKSAKHKGQASFATAVKNQSAQNIAAVNQQTPPPEQTTTGTVPTSSTELERAAALAHPMAKGETAKQFNDAKLKTGTDRITPLAAHNSTPQQHMSSTSNQSNGISAVIQSVANDSTRGDSGRQSADKGNQDASQMFAAHGKSSAASVSASNFQQYLNHKPTPVMTMFDSIQYIAQAAKNGHSKLEIQLDPAHLGKITISLQIDASKHLQVHMIVDQSATRAAVDQQLPALRHALAQQGLDLSGFSMGSQGGQTSSGFENKESFGSFRQTGIHTEIESQSTATTHQPVMQAGSGLSIHI